MVALSYENGWGEGHKKPGISHHQQRNMGLLLAPQDHNQCRVPTRGVEFKS